MKLTEESDINRYCEHVPDSCSRLEHYGAMETQNEQLQVRTIKNFLNLLFNFSFNLITHFLTYLLTYFFFCCGAATQRRSWPPHSRIF